MIALTPTGSTKTHIDKIRQDFSAKYNVKQALKNPAHITIIPPFHATQAQIDNITSDLVNVVKQFLPIDTILTHYSFFEKNRVVFISPLQNNNFGKLYLAVKDHIETKEPSIKLKEEVKYRAHVTIGYRDLSKDVYELAAADLKEKHEHIRWTIEEVEVWKRVSGEWVTI